MCDHGRGLDGRRSRAAGTGGKLRAEIDGSGGGGVAYEARRYKQGWADERAGRRTSRRPKSSQARFWLIPCISSSSCTVQTKVNLAMQK